MQIATIKNEYELDQVLELVFSIFPKFQYGPKYGKCFWLNKLLEQPELLFYAKENDVVIGAALAWVDHGQITLGMCSVKETHRGRGIGTQLVRAVEGAARSLGYDSITLGSQEGAEQFYHQLGYTGSLLIQSEIHTIEELKSVNTEYAIAYTSIYEKTVNQVCLNVPGMDKSLQRKYQEFLPGRHTMMIFRKTLANVEYD